jgi:hypothetical protein
MDTNGATYRPGHHAQHGPRRPPRFIETPEPSPVHDLLVMSHGPEALQGDRSNHACLNSFTTRSWIMAEGA